MGLEEGGVREKEVWLGFDVSRGKVGEGSRE